MADTLDLVARPSLKQEGDPPEHLSQRGGDVRAFDRRLERHVYGPDHPFEEPSDIQVENGLVRFVCGPRGLPPFLNVYAFHSDEWKHQGYLAFDLPDVDRFLLGARLSRLTPDEGTLTLTAEERGEIAVTFLRGERMQRVVHGGHRLPTTKAARYIRWLGLPPYTLVTDGATAGSGKFGSALRDGYVRLRWPTSVENGSWAIPFWWLPDNASSGQDESGLLSISNADGEQVRIRYLSATDVIEMTVGSDTVTVAATWSAGDHIFVCPRLEGETMTLSVKIASSAAVHESAATTTPSGDFTRLRFGVSGGFSPETAGDDTAGDGTAGGGKLAAGGVDNGMLFRSLTDAEAEALAAATTALDGLPSPESRLLLHIPFDGTPDVLGSDLSSGRRHHVDSADARVTEGGYTKGLGALTDVGSSSVYSGLTLVQNTDAFEVGAWLATTGFHDDLSDHHDQLAAAQEQELRAR